MAYLARLVGFSSPKASNPECPTSPSMPQALKQPLKQRLDHRSLSPTTRTREWLKNHTPDRDSKTPSILGVKGSKVVKRKQVTPSSSRRSGATAKRRGGSYWGFSWLSGNNQDDDYENEEGDDTLVEDDVPAALAPISTYRAGAGNDSTLIADGSDEDDLGDLTQEEKKEHLFSMEDERIKRQEMLKQIERADWTPEEAALFEKLTMRGFEPILPRNWMMDFKTIPEGLFTADEAEIFINAASGKDFRATTALTTLISLGVRTRDRVTCALTPEDTLRRGIESYIKWSERDGNVSRNSQSHIPVLTVAMARPKETVASVVGRVTEQLHDMGRRYREKWLVHPSVERNEAGTPRSPHYGKAAGAMATEDLDTMKKDLLADNDANGDEEEDEYSHDLPTLYGIVIKHTVVAMVTYDVCVPGQEVRSTAMFDFGIADQDVWNAFAVAILVIICRNYLMALAEEEEAEREGGMASEEDMDL